MEKCQECGKNFTPRAYQQRFCCTLCRRRHSNRARTLRSKPETAVPAQEDWAVRFVWAPEDADLDDWPRGARFPMMQVRWDLQHGVYPLGAQAVDVAGRRYEVRPLGWRTCWLAPLDESAVKGIYPARHAG